MWRISHSPKPKLKTVTSTLPRISYRYSTRRLTTCLLGLKMLQIRLLIKKPYKSMLPIAFQWTRCSKKHFTFTPSPHVKVSVLYSRMVNADAKLMQTWANSGSSMMILGSVKDTNANASRTSLKVKSNHASVQVLLNSFPIVKHVSARMGKCKKMIVARWYAQKEATGGCI